MPRNEKVVLSDSVNHFGYTSYKIVIYFFNTIELI